jgi:hypothetical protein
MGHDQLTSSPVAAGCAQPQAHKFDPADPCAMVIFGATGDLTKRLVMPALYNLSRTKTLPENFALIGVARADLTAESWRDDLYQTLKSYVGNKGATSAPPTFAASAPSKARAAREAPPTAPERLESGAATATSIGIAAPREKLAADARAA